MHPVLRRVDSRAAPDLAQRHAPRSSPDPQAGLLREVFLASFRTCPASQTYHHAYIGGLLEHTVAVASLCDELAPRYDGVDAPLLVTAALLHDIGKVDELTYDTGIGYTDEGRLTGHVVLGAMRVREAARRARLDRQTLMKLEHAILSHHGELEWGSPKRPSTLEALILHHVDNLDAKAAGFASLLKGASSIEESWTDAANLFRRPLYSPRAIEDDRPHRPAEDESVLQHLRLVAAEPRMRLESSVRALWRLTDAGSRGGIMSGLPQVEIGVFGGSGFY